jgi:hypothetical protein
VSASDEDVNLAKQGGGPETPAPHPFTARTREDPSPERFRQGKTAFLVALAVITVGLAVAGSVHREVGGGIVLAGWALALAALHRLGRAG